MITQQELKEILITGSSDFGFNGNYENHFFTPFSKRNAIEETIGFLPFFGTHAKKELSAFDDFYRNILAIVFRPIINIGYTIGFAGLAMVSLVASVFSFIASLVVSNKENIAAAKGYMETAKQSVGYTALHAINIPISSLDATTRLVTHSLGSLFSIVNDAPAEPTLGQTSAP